MAVGRRRREKSRRIGAGAATILSVMIESYAPPTPGKDGPGGRAGGGPERAPVDWAAALAEHGRWLRAAVFARVGEAQAVEEVLQEVALAAVAQRSPVTDPARAGAWLYRLAVRQALLYRRRCGRRARLNGRYAEALAAGAGAPPAPDPLAWLVRDERRGLVREALARLPAATPRSWC